MSGPVLGFIMTCYNDAEYVGEAIADVLVQRYEKIQLCVIDNGSTDVTRGVIPRDMLVGLPVNVHHGVALNIGALMLPDADWLVVQNSDDRCSPDYAQAIVDANHSDPELNCVFSPWLRMDSGQVQRFVDYDPARMIDQHMVPGIRAVRRDLWERTGGEDARIPVGSDWDWAVRASMCGMKVKQLDHAYVSIRPRTGGRVALSDQVDFPRLFAHMRRHQPGQWAVWT